MGKIYINDVGTEILVNCESDISTATTANLIVHKPNDKVVTWVGTVYNTNYIRYYTIAGDLNVAGVYKIQSQIVLPTWSGKGESASFTVYKDFD